MDRHDRIIDAATNYGYAVAGGSLERPAISTAYMKGAEWADKNPKDGMINIDDACKWLEEHYTNYMIQDLSKYVEDVCSFDIFSDCLIDDFRLAMKEQILRRQWE